MKKLNNQGFSLVELIIVIAIMAVLIGVLAPTYLGQVNNSKRSTDIQNASSVATSIAVKIAEQDNTTGLGIDGSYKEVNSTMMGGNVVPKVQRDTSYVFVAKYANNQVYVGVQKKNESTLTGDVVEIYPEDKTTGTDWAH